MKTSLIICTDDNETLSDQFIDTLRENQVAHRIIASNFQEIEDHVQASANADHIVVFPCVIGLSEAMHHTLQKRIGALQTKYPQYSIHLANPLGCDPRLIEMIHNRVSTALKGTQNSPILSIEAPGDMRTLCFEDFIALPDQIPDISTILPGRKGVGVWVGAILPDISDGLATFFADDDRFSSHVALSLVREKGLFIYAMDGQPLPASFGGPLRLLIPGHDDRCANVKGVSRAVISRG
jgi:hypothetical protein